MSIKELFRSDPTRQLEEVQKVNARERAETDVAEFHETESATVFSPGSETSSKHIPKRRLGSSIYTRRSGREKHTC
jgi:hypothetical protein